MLLFFSHRGPFSVTCTIHLPRLPTTPPPLISTFYPSFIDPGDGWHITLFEARSALDNVGILIVKVVGSIYREWLHQILIIIKFDNAFFQIVYIYTQVSVITEMYIL